MSMVSADTRGREVCKARTPGGGVWGPSQPAAHCCVLSYQGSGLKPQDHAWILTRLNVTWVNSGHPAAFTVRRLASAQAGTTWPSGSTSQASEVPAEAGAGSEQVKQLPSPSKLPQMPQKRLWSGDTREWLIFLSTNTITEHPEYLALIVGCISGSWPGVFRGETRKGPNLLICFSQFSAFHLSTKQVRILCKIMQEAQPRCCWREEGWSLGQVWRQKATVTRSLAASTARPRRSQGTWPSPRAASPNCSLCVVATPMTTPRSKGKNLIWFQHGEEPEERLALLTFRLQWGSHWPRSPELEQGVFLFAQWAALSTLEQEPSSLCKDGVCCCADPRQWALLCVDINPLYRITARWTQIYTDIQMESQGYFLR